MEFLNDIIALILNKFFFIHNSNKKINENHERFFTVRRHPTKISRKYHKFSNKEKKKKNCITFSSFSTTKQ